MLSHWFLSNPLYLTCLYRMVMAEMIRYDTLFFKAAYSLVIIRIDAELFYRREICKEYHCKGIKDVLMNVPFSNFAIVTLV